MRFCAVAGEVRAAGQTDRSPAAGRRKASEVAPLLAENEEDDNVVLAEWTMRPQPAAMAAKLQRHKEAQRQRVGPPCGPRWP
jgi:hypothetical protein